MWKSIFAGTAALAIGGASLVLAQQPQPAPQPEQVQPRGDRGDRERWRPSAEDLAALIDARIAGLKTGLRLTPEQERNWPAVETAIRAFANERLVRRAERREGRRPADPIERLRQRAEQMSGTAAGLRRLADAADPLYKSLDDGQKRRFAMLARMGMRGMGHWRAHGGPERNR